MSDVKLTSNAKKTISDKDRGVVKALDAIGLTAEKHMKEETPVDTGRLRNSMTYAVKDNAVYIGTNVEYGPYVELGSINNVAHHMVEKAATQHSTEYKTLAEAAIDSEK